MTITTKARLCYGALLFTFCTAALADNAITTGSADLYAGPDSSYPVVAQLDSNTPIQVMGCLDDWSWCDVGVEDVRGWMYSPDISYAYQDGYVPLYSYAPALGIAVVPFAIDVYWGHYYHGRPWYSRRQEWEHRELHHRRPPGPPPSASLPPRPEHREAARSGDRGIHLGSNEPARDADRRDADRRDAERRDAERREADRHGTPRDERNSPRPPEPQRAQPHVMPPAPNSPERQAPREPPHEAPRDEHARPSPVPHAVPSARPDHPRAEPAAPPKREENPH